MNVLSTIIHQSPQVLNNQEYRTPKAVFSNLDQLVELAQNLQFKFTCHHPKTSYLILDLCGLCLVLLNIVCSLSIDRYKMMMTSFSSVCSQQHHHRCLLYARTSRTCHCSPSDAIVVPLLNCVLEVRARILHSNAIFSMIGNCCCFKYLFFV